ncbi:MAG: beta-galactosidase [Clostridia bacterium]|nr:beta-galactosidase [Clostridia bacterium]
MLNRNERTILLLTGDYPGCDGAECDYITEALTARGWVVQPITVDRLMKTKNVNSLHSFMMIVPNCRNLPIETRDILRRYSTGRGSLLFLGGPLYNNLVEKDETGCYVNRPLENILDAGFTVPDPFVREGIAPSYKTYDTKDITRVTTSSGQRIYDGSITLPSPQNMTIPCETFNGRGFDNDGICRFIPLADAHSEAEGRQGTRRGSFAFIALQRTLGDGHEGKADYGLVESTAVGSAAAQIGVRCGLHTIGGADELLDAIARRFVLGLYLFEGGLDGIRYYPGEKMQAGAQILNTTPSFQRVTCRIQVETADGVQTFQEERLICPHSIAALRFSVNPGRITAGVEYGVTVTLLYGGRVIDEITSVYSHENPQRVDDPARYVSVKDDYFMLEGKPWYMAGINYWSTYSPSREKRYYWMGLFDRSNYDPVNVEDDLACMERLGLNCVLTRVDFTDFHRVVHGLRDFLIRCERHHIRVWLAFTKATASKFYSPEAVEYILSLVHVAGNPTVMTIDIEWESQGDHCNPFTLGEFTDEWESWLLERYGSVEAAESALGTPLKRDIYGCIDFPIGTTPSAAREMRDYAVDAVNRSWARLTAHLRPLIPHQLITWRHGSSCSYTFAQAAKYIDFTPLEVYASSSGFDDMSEPERHDHTVGLIVSCSLIHKYETGGRPIVWAEYGRTVCGTKWRGTLLYDHANQRYFEGEIADQTAYNRYMEEAMEEAGCAGSAPWWWCGGFRYTEMADFGFMMPDGLLNESGRNYVEFCARRCADPLRRDHREVCVVEGDVNLCSAGKPEFVRKVCIPAYREAKAAGKRLEIHTRYVGSPAELVDGKN